MASVVGIIYGIFNRKTGSCCYVGSSVNYNKRIRDHMNNCNNTKLKEYNFPIYKYIRENGGFGCFKFKVLETVMDVEDKFKLTTIEQKYINDFVSAGNVLKNKKKTAKTPRICKHGVQGSKCRECGGVNICEHNRQRDMCKECGGAGICKHNRQKHICKECDPEKYQRYLEKQRERNRLKKLKNIQS